MEKFYDVPRTQVDILLLILAAVLYFPEQQVIRLYPYSSIFFAFKFLLAFACRCKILVLMNVLLLMQYIYLYYSVIIFKLITVLDR